jgi:hypothetical protein
MGFFDALSAVESEREEEVPAHLKDANRDKEGLGHGEGISTPTPTAITGWHSSICPGLQGRCSISRAIRDTRRTSGNACSVAAKNNSQLWWKIPLISKCSPLHPPTKRGTAGCSALSATRAATWAVCAIVSMPECRYSGTTWCWTCTWARACSPGRRCAAHPRAASGPWRAMRPPPPRRCASRRSPPRARAPHRCCAATSDDLPAPAGRGGERGGAL